MVTEQTPIYGIRRLILINSGTYAFSVFPVDRPLSICGENNAGKSTAVNALQFLLLADMRDMDFGKYDALTTRKFYFPGPGSYVLVEINLEQGQFVLGAAGSGPAAQHAMQHFVFKGQFDRELFRNGDNVLTFDELTANFQKRGMPFYRVQPLELRNMLLGVPGERRLDLTMIPLRGHQERTITAWTSIFKNLLHMRNVNSQDLKQLLLHIFDIRLVASDIDFASEYQRVNAEVARLAEELRLLHKMRPHVDKLQERQTKRREFRVRLSAAYPQIQKRLEEWFEDYEQAVERNRQRLKAVEPERQALSQATETGMRQLKQVSGDRAKLQDWLQWMDKAQAEFGLVDDMGSLDTDLERLVVEQEQVVKAIGAGERVVPELIEREVADSERRKERLERLSRSWDHNVWGLLTKHFKATDLRNVFALLNHELPHLPLGGQGGVVVSDEDALVKRIRHLLGHVKQNVYKDEAVTIPLKLLDSFDEKELQDPEFVEKQMEQLGARLEALRADLKAAKTMAELLRRKEGLDATIRAKRQFRDRFERYLTERRKLDTEKTREAELRTEQERLEVQLKLYRTQERELNDEVHKIRADDAERERAKQRLQALQQRIRPLEPHELVQLTEAVELPQAIEKLMEGYELDWRDKQDVDIAVHGQLELVEAMGGGVFLRDNEDESIAHLAEAVSSISQQEELLERARRAAVAELGSSLKGLLDNYDRLEDEMKNFNRAINQRTISNLTKLELRLDPNQRVMDAIKELVKSRQFGFFADEKQASQAASFLYEWVSSQGRKLNLTHLFEICFVAFTQEGRQVLYRNLDRIESHGTTITIKALVNMHMMGQLMDEAHVGKVQIPYYLDEAASIDPKNQKNLIEQGMSMGFVPVLASVKPQPAAEYCVKLDSSHGPMVIDETAWIRIEEKPDEAKKEA